MGSFTRTVRVRTVLGAIGTGFYACAIVAAGLQWGVTRLAASLFGVGLDGVVASAGFTINPFIEELAKIAPLLAAGWWLRSKQQWGATDFVLMASGFGAGFGLFEAFGRYGQFLSTFTPFPGGYVRPSSFFPPFIPNLSGTIFSWIPAPVTKVDVSAVEPDVAPHMVWSSIAGLGIGLFFKTKTRFRILALLLVAVAGVDHAVWNYQATESLLNAGFYDTYGTSLIEPLTNIFQPARPAFWIWPLVAITTATIIDITALRRTRSNLARYIRIEPTLTQRFASNIAYAKLKPFWTIPIIWRYALTQRSASYSLDQGSETLANALTTDHQFLQQTNNRNAWRPTTVKTIWTQHRQNRPIKPAQILLFGI